MSADPFSTENRLRLLLAHVLDALAARDKRITDCPVCGNARAEVDLLVPHTPTKAKPRPVASAEAS